MTKPRPMYLGFLFIHPNIIYTMQAYILKIDKKAIYFLKLGGI